MTNSEHKKEKPTCDNYNDSACRVKGKWGIDSGVDLEFRGSKKGIEIWQCPNCLKVQIY